MSRLQSFFKHYCSIFLVLLFPLIGHTQDFPEAPNPPRLVNDLAHVMTPAQVAMLEAKLKAYSDSTSNEIAIVTIQSLGNYEVADYTVKLFKKWGVGGKKNNNGVLILASMQDRKMNITTGRGLEASLTDFLCSTIIDQEMKPQFREQAYYDGFNRATDAVMAATRGEYKGEPRSERRGPSVFPIILIVIIALIIFSRFNGGRGGGGRYISRRGSDSFGGGFLTGSILGSMLGGGNSGGGDWGGGGGGGFGGFGGGDSGGGGASGSW
jgi:uncharacterized protein